MRVMLFAAALIFTTSSAYANKADEDLLIDKLKSLSRLAAIITKCSGTPELGARMEDAIAKTKEQQKGRIPKDVEERALIEMDISSLEVKEEYSCDGWRDEAKALQSKIGLQVPGIQTDAERLKELRSKREALDKTR
jgi:hypothetical protein